MEALQVGGRLRRCRHVGIDYLAFSWKAVSGSTPKSSDGLYHAAGAFPGVANAFRLVTPVAHRTTIIWGERRYVDPWLLTTQEMSQPA